MRPSMFSHNMKMTHTHTNLEGRGTLYDLLQRTTRSVLFREQLINIEGRRLLYVPVLNDLARA